MSIRGIVGKIPSEGDFVRHNLIDPLPRGFDRWLAASVESAATLRLPTSSDPLRFIFSDGNGTGVLVGVIAPSHDAVGRTYPIALFEWCREATSPSDLSSLPVVYQGFLESAVELAGAVQGTTAAGLKNALESLPHIGPDDRARARAVCEETLDRATALAFEERVFEDGAAKRYYAYHTLLTALSVLAQGPSFGAPPTVDCPISTDVDQFAWLELFGRCLPRGASMPTVLWCEDEAPRMAVVLGAPSHLDYRFRTDDGKSDRLWPLTTTSTKACESARERLLSVDPSFGVDHGSLRGLLERVARARQ
ncbi:MAG: type VI secretion system-associated protein TagF, partial [Polyangiaceae bacterium]|nr:type VI secretion system-associated protein TagF [Polyangiaceae bacterium]